MLISIKILWNITVEVRRDYHQEPRANIRCGKIYLPRRAISLGVTIRLG